LDNKLITAEIQLGDAKIKVGGMSDPGMGATSRLNEDAWRMLLPKWRQRKPVVIVVADGMGGHKGGRKASRIVVDAFRKTYRACSNLIEPEQFLEDAVRTAHERIRREGLCNQSSRGIGSTVVASLIKEDQVSLVNVGDSRGYLIRSGNVHQLTTDHSWVEAQVRSGLLTKMEARKHPKRNQLTMAINSRREASEIKPSFNHFKPEYGDLLLLCTDGLWGVISEDEMCSVVIELALDKAVHKLIDLSKMSQGKDNITAILSKWEGS
jgi:protein phosphatase